MKNKYDELLKTKTLQEVADEEGVSRQAIWVKTSKGMEYKRKYRQTDECKEYQRKYQREYWQTDEYKECQRHRYHLKVGKTFDNCELCKE